MKCVNCQNCVRKKNGRVACRMGLWEKGDGGQFEYRSLGHFLNFGGQDSPRANPERCEHYTSMGRMAGPLKAPCKYNRIPRGNHERVYTQVYWERIQGITWKAIAARHGFKSKSSKNFTRIFPELITK